jgi:hypothetical protein
MLNQKGRQANYFWLAALFVFCYNIGLTEKFYENQTAFRLTHRIPLAI